MPDNSTTLSSWLGAWLLTLLRLGSAFALMPMPGWRGGLDLARVVLVASLSLVLAPMRRNAAMPSSPAGFALAAVGELALGLAVGLVVAFAAEGVLLAGQMISTQAGYSFATTFDPASQADSGVLQIFLSLGTGLLFFATGLDHLVLRVFARSLEAWPPGALVSNGASEIVVRFGSAALEMGLRLAMPIAGFLFLTDLFLALAGRLHAQMQLLSVAFPVKMLAALAGLAALAPMIASLYGAVASRADKALAALIR
jgi:flagellar biosynthetic protein FliR